MVVRTAILAGGLALAAPGSARTVDDPAASERLRAAIAACRQASVIPVVGNRFDCWGAPAQRIIGRLQAMGRGPIQVQSIPIHPVGRLGFCYTLPKTDPARPTASCKFGDDILPK